MARPEPRITGRPAFGIDWPLADRSSHGDSRNAPPGIGNAASRRASRGATASPPPAESPAKTMSDGGWWRASKARYTSTTSSMAAGTFSGASPYSGSSARTPARRQCGSPCAGVNHSRRAHKRRRAGTGSASRRVPRAAPAFGVSPATSTGSTCSRRRWAPACRAHSAKERCGHIGPFGVEQRVIATSPRARCAPAGSNAAFH